MMAVIVDAGFDEITSGKELVLYDRVVKMVIAGIKEKSDRPLAVFPQVNYSLEYMNSITFRNI